MNTTLTRSETAARVRAEGPVTLIQAATLFPANNSRGHVSASTLMRWIVSGKGKVRLEGARIRGKWHTSLAALVRFKDAIGV